MTTLRTLKNEARESANFRGHELGRFSTYHDGHSATAKCRNCSAYVTVNSKPAPNEIDIAGDAIAGNCPNGE